MKITKKQLNAVIKEAVFSPQHNRQMQIIADVGNFDYYIRRVQEILNSIILRSDEHPRAFNSNITMAIRLLTLAKISIDD